MSRLLFGALALSRLLKNITRELQGLKPFSYRSTYGGAPRPPARSDFSATF